MGQPRCKSLRFVSWNTNGIRYTEERTAKLPLVLDALTKLNADVVFLQETHIGPQSYEELECVEGWRSFFTVHQPRSKGVAILIKKETIFRYICHDEDYSGGYIVLFCRLHTQLYTLVNVYNHSKDRHMLYRLKDYLTAINTKGVLVVGGDFNTVLDPTFDRRSSADHTYQSSLRIILEDFTESLSLRDVFALKHPMKDHFTRSEKQSHSRLDMFFMPENTVHYVKDCVNRQVQLRQSNTGEKKISDHDPVVLDIKVPSLPEYKIPEVASMLEEFKCCGDRRTEKINGAEILSAIRSLPDSQKQTQTNDELIDYKKNVLPKTEVLKLKYNSMMKNTLSSRSPVSDNMDRTSIEYLIFAQILARRLKVFLTSSFRNRKQMQYNKCTGVTFDKRFCPQKIKKVFLEKRLSSLVSPKRITSPPKDFSILLNLLPKDSTKIYIELRQGCPLTRPILTLALKYLERKITAKCKRSENVYTSICNFRQSLLICTDNHTDVVDSLKEKFEKRSGIKVIIKSDVFC